jgi:hypothetical protein
MVLAIGAPAAAQPGNVSAGSQARKCTPMQEGKEMVRELLGYRNRCTHGVSTFGSKSADAKTVKRGDNSNAARRKAS